MGELYVAVPDRAPCLRLFVVYYWDLIPSTLSNSAVFYTTNHPTPINITYSDLLFRVDAI